MGLLEDCRSKSSDRGLSRGVGELCPWLGPSWRAGWGCTLPRSRRPHHAPCPRCHLCLGRCRDRPRRAHLRGEQLSRPQVRLPPLWPRLRFHGGFRRLRRQLPLPSDGRRPVLLAGAADCSATGRRRRPGAVRPSPPALQVLCEAPLHGAVSRRRFVGGGVRPTLLRAHGQMYRAGCWSGPAVQAAWARR